MGPFFKVCTITWPLIAWGSLFLFWYFSYPLALLFRARKRDPPRAPEAQCGASCQRTDPRWSPPEASQALRRSFVILAVRKFVLKLRVGKGPLYYLIVWCSDACVFLEIKLYIYVSGSWLVFKANLRLAETGHNARRQPGVKSEYICKYYLIFRILLETWWLSWFNHVPNFTIQGGKKATWRSQKAPKLRRSFSLDSKTGSFPDKNMWVLRFLCRWCIFVHVDRHGSLQLHEHVTWSCTWALRIHVDINMDMT